MRRMKDIAPGLPLPVVGRFSAQSKRVGDCLEWYGSSTFLIDNVEEPIRRIAWEITTGRVHKPARDRHCANLRCVHHFWPKPSLNLVVTDNDYTPSYKPGSRKLSDENIRVIRRMHFLLGITQREIAKRYVMHQVSISKICRGENYAHVPWEPDVLAAKRAAA